MEIHKGPLIINPNIGTVQLFEPESHTFRGVIHVTPTEVHLLESMPPSGAVPLAELATTMWMRQHVEEIVFEKNGKKLDMTVRNMNEPTDQTKTNIRAIVKRINAHSPDGQPIIYHPEPSMGYTLDNRLEPYPAEVGGQITILGRSETRRGTIIVLPKQS